MIMNNIFKILIATFIVTMALTVTSCNSSEFDLSQSVFIEDYDAPGLPIYSEWGYNTFGMYIDKTPFVSSNDLQAVKVIVKPDTLNIELKGRYRSSLALMRISIKGYVPADYPDLVQLNDSLLNLRNSNCTVTMNYDNKTLKLNIIQGELYFKNVQKLYVDKDLIKTNLSGKIQFKTFIDGEPVSVNNGRFDLGIGYNNFFNLSSL
ncbi:hypothetical protein MASR2M117_17210 [Paludibacter sp.]